MIDNKFKKTKEELRSIALWYSRFLDQDLYRTTDTTEDVDDTLKEAFEEAKKLIRELRFRNSWKDSVEVNAALDEWRNRYDRD